MPLIPAICTQCGAQIEVDQSKEAAICPHCGTAFIVEKAIKNYNIQQATINAKNVTIEAPFLETKIIEIPNTTKLLKYNIDAYADFGWQLHDKETFKGDLRLTFQRNKNAKWRTNELLEKEKEFEKCEKDILAIYNRIVESNEIKNTPYSVEGISTLVIGIILSFFGIIGFAISMAAFFSEDFASGMGIGMLVFAIIFLIPASMCYVGYFMNYKAFKERVRARNAKILKPEEIDKLNAEIEQIKERRLRIRKEASALIDKAL